MLLVDTSVWVDYFQAPNSVHAQKFDDVLGKIEVVQRGKTRQAKLYYLRARKGKAARIKVEEQGSSSSKN